MCAEKILISDATSYKSVVVTGFIKRLYPEVKIFTCDSRRASRFFHTRYSDKHLILSNAINEGQPYLDEIRRVIEHNSIDIYLPINSYEMRIVMHNKDSFGKALSYCGSFESFKQLDKKDDLARLCSGLDIKIPKIFGSIYEAELPIVAKPKQSASSKGIVYIKSEKEKAVCLRKYESFENFIFQQYIEGFGAGYSVFCNNGKVVTGYGHKRLAEYPVSGGSSMYREGFCDERMKIISEKLISTTNWSGFAMFEFKVTRSDEVYLIEVNPRIWGSINQGLANSANYFESLLGKKESRKHREYKTYFSPFVYLSFIQYLLRGNFKPLGYFLKNIRLNKADISLLNDPMAWLGSFLRL